MGTCGTGPVLSRLLPMAEEAAPFLPALCGEEPRLRDLPWPLGHGRGSGGVGLAYFTGRRPETARQGCSLVALARLPPRAAVRCCAPYLSLPSTCIPEPETEDSWKLHVQGNKKAHPGEPGGHLVPHLVFG